MTETVADAYATMAEFRTFLRITATTDATDPDSGLELVALEAARQAIDVSCNRSFEVKAASVSTRYFTYDRPRLNEWPDWRNAVLTIDDVFDVTGMLVHHDTAGDATYATAVTTYRTGPANAAARSMPFTQLVYDTGTYPPTNLWGVRVQALWGWAAIPSIIKNANLIQAARFLKRRDAAFGVAGSPDMGNELRLMARLDPDVALMVGAYRRNWGAV